VAPAMGSSIWTRKL